ncbi:MAG: hypothetical protein JOZ55_04230 [Alphaproteobacteria bacterium]|nr:hypothetical protein [Alphaproteobacteria bacterium]
MTATLFLRIAAVFQLLFAVGHSLGGLKKWSPMGPNAVLDQMTNVRFTTMGANRSYLDYFLGFGWSISVAMLLQAVLLFLMASLARTEAARLRPMILAFAVASLATAVIGWRYIFPVPALFSLAVLIPLIAAWVVAR